MISICDNKRLIANPIENFIKTTTIEISLFYSIYYYYYYFSTAAGDPWQRGHVQHRGLVALPADRGLRPQTAAPLQPQQDGLPEVIFVGVIIVMNFFMENMLKWMTSVWN